MEFSAYLEPGDLRDGISEDIKDKEGIVSLCSRDLVCGLHVFWFLPLGGQGGGGLVPVLESYQSENVFYSKQKHSSGGLLRLV